jgi:site-specific DNA-cytosine methylase
MEIRALSQNLLAAIESLQSRASRAQVAVEIGAGRGGWSLGRVGVGIDVTVVCEVDPAAAATYRLRLVHYAKDWLMTPRELARLQGYPDTYRFAGAKCDVLRRIGNAVPVGQATATGRSLLGMLGAGIPLAEGKP